MLLLAGPAAVCWGCNTDSSASSPMTIADSAGVRVVTNYGAGGPIPRWEVEATPRLSVGSNEGEVATRLFRVADALRLADGGVLIADGGSGEIRHFGADGRHIRSFGGLGDGPGEFRRVSALSLGDADELVIYDRGLHRVTRYGIDGTFRGSYQVGLPEADGRTLFPTRLLAQGATLVGREGQDLSSGPSLGVTRDTARWVRVHPASDSAEVIVSVPGSWSVQFEVQGQRFYRVAPLTPRPSWDLQGATLYVSPGATFEIRVIDLDEGTQGIWRRSVQREQADEAVISSWEAGFEQTAALPASERPRLLDFYDAMPYPDSLPAYSDLHADPLGYLWAERFHHEYDPERLWDVYSGVGEFMGTVELPAGLWVLEIGEDYVLGIHYDDLGVEYVREYGLVRT